MEARICAETKSMSMQSCQRRRIFSPREIHHQLGRARVPLVPLRIRGVLGGAAVSPALPFNCKHRELEHYLYEGERRGAGGVARLKHSSVAGKVNLRIDAGEVRQERKPVGMNCSCRVRRDQRRTAVSIGLLGITKLGRQIRARVQTPQATGVWRLGGVGFQQRLKDAERDNKQ